MNIKKVILTKENEFQVPCLFNIPENCEKVVIIIHGICSCKESDNATFLLNYMPQNGIGAIAYDQPAHGSQEAAREELRIKNCLDSLAEVEKYIIKNYPGKEVCYFGSSFGAYILGLYLALRKHQGTRAFMRCAAVNFPDLILKNPASASLIPEFELLKPGETKDLDLGLGDTVKVGSGFFTDIRKYSLIDIYNENLPKDTTLDFTHSIPDLKNTKPDFACSISDLKNVKLEFAHGALDPVVSLAAVKEFTSAHGYPLTIFAGEEHSISNLPDSPAKVAKLALDHFSR